MAAATATAMTLTFLGGAQAQTPPRQMEKLGRGVVAISQGDGKVFVSWRVLGTDPDNIAFNLYRSRGGASVKLNAQPITGGTNFVDAGAKGDQAASYFVRPVMNGQEGAPSAPFTLAANAEAKPYLSIPLQTTAPPYKLPARDEPYPYAANDASVGDLDGDGEYEIVVHMAAVARDNSHAGETSPPILQAYKLDGKLLWSINLGRNIREGAHYTQFMVYDLDGDGRAEMVCKTADGTTDGRGAVIGDANADWRNQNGYILAGPEYLTVFDGLTGKALATTKYIPGRHPDTENPTGDQLKAIWGDGYGNRPDRFLACIAYLDGVHPSVVMCRGYYTRTVLAAWDWRGDKLTNRWVFDSSTPGNEKYAGQGNHNLSVADVDGDGKDEILYGGMAVDDNGKGLYTTGIGHGDAIHVSDLDPSRPGLEVFRIQEPFADAGAHLFDARTGEVLWKKASVAAGSDREGPGRGLALDVDPRYPGFECWVAGAGLGGKLWDARGNQIADKTPSINFGVYWDGDLLSEILDGAAISKWDYLNAKSEVILNARDYNCVSNNGTKATPALSADILGDWREEVIWRTEDNKELRIFTTTIPTEHRFYTFMHDPEYRLSIAWQNVGYNQPPHTDFYIGPGMKQPPRPNITLVAANSSPSGTQTSAGTPSWKFDFVSGPVATGCTQVLPTSAYSKETGYGFEPGAQVTAEDRGQPDALRGDSITSDRPFRFSVDLPEGNYNVTVTLGAPGVASNTTVKAEARRLMLENIQTSPGQFETRTFTVNIRTPKIAGNSKPVSLRNWGPPLPPSWDEKLTLEFNGTKPSVAALEIARVEDALTVFLAGDSTVTDQGGEPWAAWGQMLPRFFLPGVAVANYAESGLSLGTFRGQRRLDKIRSILKPGDYVFIQFGHNDQKEKGGGPFTTYKANLLDFVAKVREKGGLPVIVTPMERRRWSPEGKPERTLADYAEAVRQTGREEHVPVIDLQAMSLQLYEALGPENSKKAFVHYAAGTFPGQREALKDDTHFNNYGAYELARCVVEGIKANVPALARRLADDVKPYDPARPDSVERFGVPASPLAASEKPAGS